MDDRPLMWVRDYVESLHQNSRTTLLFGKNNVLVQPVRAFNQTQSRESVASRHVVIRYVVCVQRDDMEAIPGYLSLHQTADLMTLKWTPNQLMNGNVGELDSEKRWAQRWLLNILVQLVHILQLLLTVCVYSVLQCILGLRHDNSFGGDCVSPLSPARYGNPATSV